MCGNCCRNLRGRLDKEAIERHQLSYLYHRVEPSDLTINAFEWEIERLMNLGEHQGKQILFEPDLVFYDEYSELPIAIGWNLNHDNCPFLTPKNKCAIYDHRPLTCQAFPLFEIGIMNFLYRPKIELHPADCPEAITIPNKFKKISELATWLYDVYGDSAVGAYRIEFAGYTIRHLTRKFTQTMAIRAAKITEQVIKEIKRKEPIGFFQFLQSEAMMTKKEIEAIVKEIETANFQRTLAHLTLWNFKY